MVTNYWRGVPRGMRGVSRVGSRPPRALQAPSLLLQQQQEEEWRVFLQADGVLQGKIQPGTIGRKQNKAAYQRRERAAMVGEGAPQGILFCWEVGRKNDMP